MFHHKTISSSLSRKLIQRQNEDLVCCLNVPLFAQLTDKMAKKKQDFFSASLRNISENAYMYVQTTTE